jgi:hypothetical protein
MHEARVPEVQPPTAELADPAGFLVVERKSDAMVGMAMTEAVRTAGGQKNYDSCLAYDPMT